MYKIYLSPDLKMYLMLLVCNMNHFYAYHKDQEKSVSHWEQIHKGTPMTQWVAD